MTDRDDEQATPPPDPSWLRPWEREAERPVSTTTFVSPRRKRRSPFSRLVDVLPGRGGTPSQPDAPSAREAQSEPPADTAPEPADLEQPPAPSAEDEADLDRWFDDLDLDPAPPLDVDHDDEDARLDDGDTPEDGVAEAEDDSDEEQVLGGPDASAEAFPTTPGSDDEPEVAQPATGAVPEATGQVAETPTEAPAQPPAEPAPTDVPKDLDRDETPDDEIVDRATEHPAVDLDEDQRLAVAAFLDDPDDEDHEVDEPSGPDAAAAYPTAPAEAPAGVDEEPSQDAPGSAEAFGEEGTEPDGPAEATTELDVALDEGIAEPEHVGIATPEPHPQVEVEADEPGAEPDETHRVDEKIDEEVDDADPDEPALPADPGTIGTAEEDASEQATTPDLGQEPEEFAPAPSGTEDDEPDDTSVAEAVATTLDDAPTPGPASGTDGEPDDDPSEPQPVSDEVPTELEESDDRVPAPDAPALEASSAAPTDGDITEAEAPAPDPRHETHDEPEEEPTARPTVPEEVAGDLDESEERAAEPAGAGLDDSAEAVEAGELADPDPSPHAGTEAVATPLEEALAPEPEPEADTVSEDGPTDPASAPGAAAAELDEPAADRGLDDDEEHEAAHTTDEEPVGAGDKPHDHPDVEPPGPDAATEALEDADRAGPDVPGQAPPEPAARSLEEASSPEPDGDDEPEAGPTTALAVPEENAADLDESDGTAHEPLEEALTDTDLAEEADQDLEDGWVTAEPDASAEADPEAGATDVEEPPAPAPELEAHDEPHEEPEEEPDASLAVPDEATAEPDEAEAEEAGAADEAQAELDEPVDRATEEDAPAPTASAEALPDADLPEPVGPPRDEDLDELHESSTTDAPTHAHVGPDADQDLGDAWTTAEPDASAEALEAVDRAEPEVLGQAASEPVATPLEAALPDADPTEEADADAEDEWATAEPVEEARAPEPEPEPDPGTDERPDEAPHVVAEEPGQTDDRTAEEPAAEQQVAPDLIAADEAQPEQAAEPATSAPSASVEAAPPVVASPSDAEIAEPATPTPEPELDETEYGPWLRDVDETARDLDETDRRARRLLAGAALSLLVVAVVFGGVRVAQDRSAEAAREQAARQQQVTTLAVDVLDLADVVGPTAGSLEPVAGALLVTLEEHLLASERSDAELDEARSQAVGELRAAADQLRDALGGPAPVPGTLVPARAADPVLLAHARVRAEATALAGEADAAAEQADTWGAAVRSVTAALATHARIASEQPETSDPDELADAWLAEVEPLRALADVAADAATVPGLEAWADAHVAFAEDSLAWVERAAGLLEDGELETYNTELEETLGVDDPFGFSAALEDATRAALDSPALDAVAIVEARAALVAEQVDALEQTTGERLATALEP